MEKSLGDFFAVILVLFLLIIGGYMMVSMRKRLILEGFPGGDKRKFIMGEIMRMTQEHKAHADKLKFLRQQGMSKSVAEALLGEADRKFSQAHGAVTEAVPQAVETKPAAFEPAGKKSSAQLKLS